MKKFCLAMFAIGFALSFTSCEDLEKKEDGEKIERTIPRERHHEKW